MQINYSNKFTGKERLGCLVLFFADGKVAAPTGNAKGSGRGSASTGPAKGFHWRSRAKSAADPRRRVGGAGYFASDWAKRRN